LKLRTWRRARLGPIASLRAAAALVPVAALAGVAIAASSITDLGSPTNNTALNSLFPLDGFHRVHTSVGSRGHAELLFLGTMYPNDFQSQVERWPVVKALDQFGTLTGVRPDSPQCVLSRNPPCTYATFDWSRAQYRSRYLTFAHVDMLHPNGKLFQPLTPAEKALYNRYARVRGGPMTGPDDIANTIFHSWMGDTSRGLPLVVVGEYLQTRSPELIPGYFRVVPVTPTTAVLAYPPVEASLRSRRDPPGSQLVEAVNAEANIITAVICNADGDKPASVCSRPVIKTILRSVK